MAVNKKEVKCPVCKCKANLGTNKIDTVFYKCKQDQLIKYTQGYLTTCKSCLEKQVVDSNGDIDKDKLVFLLKSYFDRPFIHEIFIKTLHTPPGKTTSLSQFKEYMRRLNITFKNGEGFDVSELNNEEITERLQLKKTGMTGEESDYLKVIWGEYSPTDLTFLKLHLEKLLGVYECSTPIQESLYMNICRAELQARKCLGDGDVNGYEKAVKIISMLSGDLSIKPSNTKDTNSGNALGVMIKNMENIMPSPEPLPEFKDVNRIEHYFKVFFVKQIARMTGRDKSPVEEDFNEEWN